MQPAAKTWAEMTWQEKREERFKRWLAAPGVQFVSAEAEKLYKLPAVVMELLRGGPGDLRRPDCPRE